jgi:hypothetical protein
MVVVSVVSLGACGSSPGGDAEGRDAETAASGVAAIEPVTTNSVADDPGSTEPASSDPAAADVFVDPQGSYTMSISTGWRSLAGVFVKEIEGWAIGETPEGFTPNVIVLTQDAPGMDLASYLEFSAQNLGGLDLIEKAMTTGTNGNELGLLEYDGLVSG